jgi:aminoglycoside/choline kinase family phosphotransferase
MPVPVPHILGHADDLGVLALEDLGDVTLQAHLGSAAPSAHAALYREAVGFIDTIQKRGRDLASADFLPYGIAFDEEKLTWELNFFIKHYLVGYRHAEGRPQLRGRRSMPNAPPSCVSSLPSPACFATATTTAAI